MKNILIVCNAGMSSGMLAQKMNETSEGEINVKAVGISEYIEVSEGFDMILVGPQVRFQLGEIKKDSGLPTMSIDLSKYGIMDAEGILNDAIKFYKN